MTHPQRSEVALQIHKPCPKSWSQLSGDERRRFCSECSLHVYNAEQLTRDEAQALVSDASARVCMRLAYDPHGAPVFRDSEPAARAAPASPRWMRWALSAAAGLLAACHGSVSTPTSNDPGGAPNLGQAGTTRMGKVISTELLGDVMTPQPVQPERMGEVEAVVPDATSVPSPDAPAKSGGK